MNDKIRDLIRQYEKPGDFTHVAPPDGMEDLVMAQLGVTLPKQFLEYLEEYSHGGIDGIEVFGIGLNGSITFIEETLHYRKYGLPDNLVVIVNCDEWEECIDCDTGKIVSWDLSGEIVPTAPCFDDYLLDELENAIENM